MSFDSILELTSAALGNERLRAEIASLNISRANTPLNNSQIQASEFSNEVNQKGSSNLIEQPYIPQGSLGSNGDDQNATGIRQVYDPTHNLANEHGFVSYPEIDLATEFVTLTLAKRAYEANVRIFNTMSGMHSKTLELGK